MDTCIPETQQVKPVGNIGPTVDLNGPPRARLGSSWGGVARTARIGGPSGNRQLPLAGSLTGAGCCSVFIFDDVSSGDKPTDTGWNTVRCAGIIAVHRPVRVAGRLHSLCLDVFVRARPVHLLAGTGVVEQLPGSGVCWRGGPMPPFPDS